MKEETMENRKCKDCGHYMSWHDDSGTCSPAFGCGYMACPDAINFKQADTVEDENEYDFTDPNQNPYFLSHEEAERLRNKKS